MEVESTRARGQGEADVGASAVPSAGAGRETVNEGGPTRRAQLGVAGAEGDDNVAQSLRNVKAVDDNGRLGGCTHHGCAGPADNDNFSISSGSGIDSPQEDSASSYNPEDGRPATPPQSYADAPQAKTRATPATNALLRARLLPEVRLPTARLINTPVERTASTNQAPLGCTVIMAVGGWQTKARAYEGEFKMAGGRVPSLAGVRAQTEHDTGIS